MKSSKKILVVSPCYNEGEGLHHIVQALAKVRKALAPKYQLDVLLVNDGSTDDTQEAIYKAASKFDFVFYRQFAHNAGHQSALRAGLNTAVNYDATIMMDADMQHPPQLIPDMIAKWEDGAKVVQMIREDSIKDNGIFKFLTSYLYYVTINWLSGLKLESGASDFRLIDKSVTQTVVKSPESSLFLRAYFSWLKVPRATLTYIPNQRIAGKSKYSIRKLFELAYRGILQFSEKPLRIAVGIGLLFAVGAIIYGLVLTALYISGIHTAVDGWTSLMVGMLFCFGINFILLGIIGHYLAYSINIQKQRPEFIIASEKLPNSGENPGHL